jgi:PadR family transcriptional regulator, regulatory protein AphA
MSSPELNPVSYVVLGLVARDGPSTPYELKTAVGRGIAHFWQFPHSQIYAETERLARLGLLAETREESGRRRRTYRITRQGRAAFEAWLAEPTSEPTQLRSLGLLQLYFGWFAAPEDVAALARAQVEMHRERSVGWNQVFDVLEGREDRLWQREVAELAFKAEQSMAEQWERVLRRAEDGARRAAGD